MSLKIKFAKFKFGVNARVEFYKQVSTFVEDGVPLDDIMERMVEIYSPKDGDIMQYLDHRPVIARDILMQMSVGNTFAKSLTEWVPANECSLISSGEDSGGLTLAMRNAIRVSESLAKIRSTLISGLSYPAVLFTALIAIMFLFALSIIPKLAEMISPDKWEGAAANLYTFSTLLSGYWWVAVLVVMAYSGFCYYAMPNYVGGARRILDKIQPFSLYRVIQSASFLIAVSAMMKSGVPFEKALSKQMGMSSPYNMYFINKMLQKLREGRKDGDSLDVVYFDKEVIQEIKFYGDSSDFQRIMEILGRKMTDQAIKSIEAKTANFRVMVIVSLGVFIGWVYYAFFTLTQAIGDAAAMGM